MPRYADFAPRHAANVYAREAALVGIECQACRTPFKVCVSGGRLAAEIRGGSLHYGDPRNVECCIGCPTMNCVDVKVLEYWRRKNLDWERNPALEVGLKR